MLAKPFQKPRPEIVGTVVAPFSPGVVLMGKRDFHPLSANFLLSNHLKSHWTNYAKGKAEAGQKANVADWRVARTIFVADDDKVAARYGCDDANSPYRRYFSNMRAKMMRGNRLYVFKSHKEQPDSEITLDYVMQHCVTFGTVNKVTGRHPQTARGDRRFRRDRLCRHGLGRSGACQALDAADGRRGDAARERGNRKAGQDRGGVTFLVMVRRPCFAGRNPGNLAYRRICDPKLGYWTLPGSLRLVLGRPGNDNVKPTSDPSRAPHKARARRLA